MMGNAIKYMDMGQGKIHIGTSGYAYKNWKGDFYPKDLDQKQWLSFYAQEFDSVEINNSFYHLPSKDTFSKWASQTPDSFVFSVKASRYITHMKKLKDPQEPLKKFRDCASGLGSKMGPILFQLPANFKKKAERLENFLSTAKPIKGVFEFRHSSWFDPQIMAMLDDFGCGVVMSSGKGFPCCAQITGSICYMRLHGTRKLYHSSYSHDALQHFAALARGYAQKGIDCFIYFNNDALGHAHRNAYALRKMLL